jgi:long-chain fatty acid transport protein
MKKGFLLSSIVLLKFFVSSSVFANGLYLNGVGFRAMSMGGAFVGLSDDYSAGFWNPATASQMDWSTVGFYAAFYSPTST